MSTVKLCCSVSGGITIYIISSVMHAFWLVLTYDLLEDRLIDDVIIKTFFPYILILYYIKQIDSKFPCVCSVIDHRLRQNVVRTKKWPTRRSRVCHRVTYSSAPRSSSAMAAWCCSLSTGFLAFNYIPLSPMENSVRMKVRATRKHFKCLERNRKESVLTK